MELVERNHTIRLNFIVCHKLSLPGKWPVARQDAGSQRDSGWSWSAYIRLQRMIVAVAEGTGVFGAMGDEY